MKGDPYAYEGEVPAEIRSTVRLGPIFLTALVLVLSWLALSLVALFFVRSDILSWIASIFIFVALGLFLVGGLIQRSKAGPVIAWFKPRTEQVYVSVDTQDLVIRRPGEREAYRPSKLEWVDSKIFNITEGPMTIQLAFKTIEQASTIVSMIKKTFPGIIEKQSPSLTLSCYAEGLPLVLDD